MKTKIILGLMLGAFFLTANAQSETMQDTPLVQAAPGFTLKSNTGETYSLEDFKGKVVYIDLWATWCGPCRNEIPKLAQLYDKYKDDERIVIVSICVHDDNKKWTKVVEEDNPGWLQLFDAEGEVAKGYRVVSIPQFILIDKDGNIVDANAPRPSKPTLLEPLLLKEMEK